MASPLVREAEEDGAGRKAGPVNERRKVVSS
jgi:hypothetical protein